MGVATHIPNSALGVPVARAAMDYARELHRGQLREADGAAFILHPREVAALLGEAGASPHLVAAGALHDVIEKTPATAFDLRRRFGSTIATLVLAVTEDRGISSYAARKRALRDQVASAGDEALLLFAADKISKARELRLHPTRRSLRARRTRARRLAHYRRCLALLQERLPDSPLAAQLEAELGGLRPLHVFSSDRVGVWG